MNRENGARGAVLIVDMQPPFLRTVRKGDFLVDTQEKVVNCAALCLMPVVALEYAEHGKTVPKLVSAIKSAGDHSFIVKRTNSGFVETELEARLKEWDVDRVYLMGIAASNCVLLTADDAQKRGFGVITARDVISDSVNSTFDRREWYGRYGDYFRSHVEMIHDMYFNGG